MNSIDFVQDQSTHVKQKWVAHCITFLYCRPYCFTHSCTWPPLWQRVHWKKTEKKWFWRVKTGVCLIFTCWLANCSLSVKSWWPVNNVCMWEVGLCYVYMSLFFFGRQGRKHRSRREDHGTPGETAGYGESQHSAQRQGQIIIFFSLSLSLSLSPPPPPPPHPHTWH